MAQLVLPCWPHTDEPSKIWETLSLVPFVGLHSSIPHAPMAPAASARCVRTATRPHRQAGDRQARDCAEPNPPYGILTTLLLALTESGCGSPLLGIFLNLVHLPSYLGYGMKHILNLD